MAPSFPLSIHHMCQCYASQVFDEMGWKEGMLFLLYYCYYYFHHSLVLRTISCRKVDFDALVKINQEVTISRHTCLHLLVCS